MVGKEEYVFDERGLYTAQARSGPLNSKKNYSIPVHSSVDPKNPLRGLLERISLDVAEKISIETGRHVEVSLIVREEKVD